MAGNIINNINNQPLGIPGGNVGLNSAGIDYVETRVKDGESPTEKFAYDQSSATRYLLIDYDQLATAVPCLLGWSKYSGTDGLFSRWLPEYHPRFPWLWASSVQSRGLGVATGADSDVKMAVVRQNTPTVSFAPQYGGDIAAFNNPFFISTPLDQFDTMPNTNGRKVARYEYALLQVEYEALDYPMLSDTDEGKQEQNPITFTPARTEKFRYVSMGLAPQGDYLSLPNNVMKWAAGTSPDGYVGPSPGDIYPENIGKMVNTIDLVFTWHQVPYNGIPMTSIFSTIGCINRDDFYIYPDTFTGTLFTDPSGNTGWFKWGTLLLTQVNIKRLKCPFAQDVFLGTMNSGEQGGGSFVWEIEYHMKWNRNGHLNFFDFAPTDKSTPRGWFQINIDGQNFYGPGSWVDGKTLFDGRNYDNLFAGP